MEKAAAVTLILTVLLILLRGKCAGVEVYGAFLSGAKKGMDAAWQLLPALPGMLHRQSGCILNVASMWGQVGASCEACYSATKGAVLALTKALAQELGPSGIRVNAVSPGVILTDMVKNVSAETLASLAEETPLEHNGSPEDIAQALLYLAQASFVTGQNLPVNGGFVL